jgi:hypothetical protein
VRPPQPATPPPPLPPLLQQNSAMNCLAHSHSQAIVIFVIFVILLILPLENSAQLEIQYS